MGSPAGAGTQRRHDTVPFQQLFQKRRNIMNRTVELTCVVLAVSLAVLTGQAQGVFIDLVEIGDMSNTGELSGASAGGAGVDRICGAVDYDY